MSLSAQDALACIRRGVEELISEDELLARLEKGQPLRVKLGLDPTAPDIHVGHTVVLNKLRQFQELGHTVIFLIGDFTATIGDPSGKDAMRKPMTMEQVAENTRTYERQAFKILDPEHTELACNSTWMNAFTAQQMVQLASTYTVARMLERDDFHKRYSAQQPIAIHEFLYPLFQGYDSVALQADVELGGTDQKFNLLVGRELQKHFSQRPQCILTMPVLEGLDGVQKMSKSLNNYIAITDTPDDMLGKLMSISDDLMWRYYILLSAKSDIDIQRLKSAVVQGRNPRDIKMMLAEELVTRFHHKQAAEDAARRFSERFQQHRLPDNLESIKLASNQKAWLIGHILQRVGLVQSTSEAMRMIQQGAVRIDGERIADVKQMIEVGETHIYQVGRRRFAKVSLV